MTKRKSQHIGSSFESWLDEHGVREEVTAAATKEVVAAHLAAELKKKRITKADLDGDTRGCRAEILGNRRP